MNKIISWALGVVMGSAVGAVLVALFSPIPPEEIRARLKTGYAEALDEARRASQQRRAELELELAQMQGREPASSDSEATQ